MEFRPAPDQPPVEITLDQFCDLVRAGGVKPTALYREPWTRGEWRTVDNLRVFHKHSPTQYPLGSHLAAAQRQRQHDERRAEAFRRQAVEYNSGPLIERVFGLRGLAQVATDPGVSGVARLQFLPSFHPERLVTVAFTVDGLAVETVMAKELLWRSVIGATRTPPEAPATESHPPGPADVARASALVPYRSAPAVFSSWGHFFATVSALESCETLTLDGIGYRHQLCHDGAVTDVRWGNPRTPEHARQLAVIGDYTSLVRATRLGGEFLKGLRGY